ncbi:MAG: hypothetical protein ACKO23_21850 [Gemmataceae bacterium]
MNPRAFRLIMLALLLVAWLGYLGYLVWTRPVTATGWPLVLSRPQIMTSQIDIVAYITDPEKSVEVEEVLWPSPAAIKPGDSIPVSELAAARPLARFDADKVPADFSGPGRYLVPLRESAPGRYEVAPIPISPGFQRNDVRRIYPANRESIAQYRSIRKAAEGAQENRPAGKKPDEP